MSLRANVLSPQPDTACVIATAPQFNDRGERRHEGRVRLRPMAEPGIGTELREWRSRRRLSQLDLALEAGVSTRHLSFVETGRSRPSAELVLSLAEHLEVPLRERNALLLAAGYAPRYSSHSLDDQEMTPIRDALTAVLEGHEPHPALAVDHHWDLVASNAALGVLLEDVSPQLLEPPVNTLRLALHPDGMAPRVVNLSAWRQDLMHRLERALAIHPDPQLLALHEELLGYPAGDAHSTAGPEQSVMFPLVLRSKDYGELVLYSTITTFGPAYDVTVAELAVEAFFPADARTAAALASAAAAADS
jgi:transcriptional regulator with XRE-family HTH domain